MKNSGIGGQAVMEGVMMKNNSKYAVAVRKPDKEIEVQVFDDKTSVDKVQKIPIVRGVFNFVSSLLLGMKSLTFSASFIEDEEEEQLTETVKKKVSGPLTPIGCKMLPRHDQNLSYALMVSFSAECLIQGPILALFLKNTGLLHGLNK